MTTLLTVLATVAKALLLATLTVCLVPVLAALGFAWLRLRARRYGRTQPRDAD